MRIPKKIVQISPLGSKIKKLFLSACDCKGRLFFSKLNIYKKVSKS
ncbi:hypothetical protein [Thermotoga profunda]|nr:hypothetical protein [Thermotoga profunda]